MSNNREIAELVTEYNDNEGEISSLIGKLRSYSEALSNLTGGLGYGKPPDETVVIDNGIRVKDIAQGGVVLIGLDLLHAVAADLQAYRQCIVRKQEQERALRRVGLSGLIHD